MSELYAVAGIPLLSSVLSPNLTPPDFCLIPIGTANTSVAEEVAECQRVLAASGLTYKRIWHKPRLAVSRSISYISLTVPEGPWSKVSQAIHDCHAAVHAKGALRIATDIRIGTRIDRDITPGQGNDAKVTRVQSILAQDNSS
ncbi:UPF0045 protein [Psilocybe cubensis]|uniref:UPF0045 protein n=2 Tax=Psilocybe cubensis TaxID=181762 RepID=A0ACB8H7T3_PSICU|nr:UPF0045 protein [Psilocybe cubensis]KAH9483931.1 UPF0045 protein [Psilocybe cubensis]